MGFYSEYDDEIQQQKPILGANNIPRDSNLHSRDPNVFSFIMSYVTFGR